MAVKQDFPDRYASNWPKIRKDTLLRTGGLCVMCRAKACEVHHTRYSYWDGRKWQRIAGKEQPLKDVFPLCRRCHGTAHSSQYWIWDKQNPDLGNRNTDDFVKYLQSCVKPRKKPQPPALSAVTWGDVCRAFWSRILT